MNFSRRKFLHLGTYSSLWWLLGMDTVSAAQRDGQGNIVYTVKRGDTLSEIAQKYKIKVSAIKAKNNLKSDLIRIGQVLILPVKGGYEYIGNVVKATDKLSIKRNRWKYIVAHHSGIDRGNADSYHKYHLRRGMDNGLAYHFVIGNGIDSRDGQVEIGPRWKKQLDGGHVKSHKVNKTGIGICVVGNFEKKRPSRRQMAAFYELITYLRGEVISNHVKVTAHKEVDGSRHTVCPGRYFPLRQMHKKFG